MTICFEPIFRIVITASDQRQTCGADGFAQIGEPAIIRGVFFEGVIHRSLKWAGGITAKHAIIHARRSRQPRRLFALGIAKGALVP